MEVFCSGKVVSGQADVSLQFENSMNIWSLAPFHLVLIKTNSINIESKTMIKTITIHELMFFPRDVFFSVATLIFLFLTLFYPDVFFSQYRSDGPLVLSSPI